MKRLTAITLVALVTAAGVAAPATAKRHTKGDGPVKVEKRHTKQLDKRHTKRHT